VAFSTKNNGRREDVTLRRNYANSFLKEINQPGARALRATSTRQTEIPAMSDEQKLQEAASTAVRAQALIENELLAEAFKELEDNYTGAWRASTIDDVNGREKLFLAINIVGKVRDHLTTILTNGKLAQAELKELAQTAERRKRFGIL
jgi:hypothetical protein